MRRIAQSARIVVLAVLAVWTAPSAQAQAQAQDVVSVRGGLHEGFGRLVFDWPEAVRYRAFIRDGQLRLEFERPAEFQSSGAFPALNAYLGAPAQGPHGFRLTFPLKDQFGLRHSISNNRVIVDLIDPSAGTPPPQLPAISGAQIAGDSPDGEETSEPEADQAEASGPPEDAPSTATVPSVTLRIGQHRDFDRLVFDWPENVGYRVEQAREGDSARVRFESPAELDLSDFAEDRPERVRTLVPSGTARESGIDMTMPRGSEIRHFPLEKRVVVDVFAPGARIPADTPGQPAEIAPSGGEEPNGAPDSPSAGVLADAPEPPAVDDGRTAAESRNEPPPRPASPPRAALEQRPDAAEPARAATPRPSGEPLPLVAPDSRDRTPGAEPDVSFFESGYTPEQIARGDAPRPGEMPARIEPARVDLPWGRRTGAVYRRGGSLWVLLEGQAPADFADRLAATTSLVDEANLTQPQDGVSLIRIDGPGTLQADLTQHAGVWELYLSPQSMLPTRPLVTEQEDGHVRIPVLEQGPVVDLTDPGAGGSLTVVPVAEAGRGMALERNFPEFSLLATGLGVAVLSKTDALRVRTTEDAVIVEGADQPLMVSRAGRASGEPDLLPRRDGRGLLDLPAWRRSDEGFSSAKQQLQQAVGDAEPSERAAARLDLARFYFSHGLATETLGALSVYAEEVERREQDPQVRLMTGAAQMLDEKWREAGRQLADPALEGVPEALPWRAAFAAVSGAEDAAFSGFQRSRALLEDYPDTVRKRLHLLAAEAGLRSGDLAGAEAELDTVRSLSPNRSEEAQADYIAARIALESGEVETAEEIWRRLAAGQHAPTRARSRFVMAERELAAERSSHDDTVAELERLRFSWRGDGFEAALLQRLADLYLEGGEYRRGLTALRQAASHLPGTGPAEQAAERMRGIFANLFLDGEADAMPTLQALALYEGFRELTPPGDDGNRMIENLADRLVQVDLLDRAAALLEAQVRHRLEGREKARTGVRLASIRLLDDQPEAALDALNMSQADGVPADLSNQRRQLRARALASAGRNDEALLLLVGDNSLDGLGLAADIHSERDDWSEAADALIALLPATPDEGELLDNEDAQKVVRAAVALTLSGDTRTLTNLYQQYGPSMDDGPRGDAFRLFADRGPSGIDTISRRLAEVGRAQDFMESYRDRLREQAAAVPR